MTEQRRAASANIIIALLAERFPKCFVVYQRKLLKIRILCQHHRSSTRPATPSSV
jgi:sRNA-binding protein